MEPIRINGEPVQISRIVEAAKAILEIQRSATRTQQFGLAADMIVVREILLEVAVRLDAGAAAETTTSRLDATRPNPGQNTRSAEGSEGPVGAFPINFALGL